MTETVVTLDDIERAAWRLSGWRVEQRSLDELLGLIRQCMGAPTPAEVPELLTAARNEAAQIVQAAREEAALLSPGPPDGLRRMANSSVSTEVYKAPDGALWVRLTEATETAVAGHRKCRTCGRVKPLARFRRETKGKENRRHQCHDCANAAKRERTARKQAS